MGTGICDGEFLLLVLSDSVMSDSLQPHELQSTRLLCPWDSPGKNTGVSCHALLQGILQLRDQTRVSCIGRQILYHCHLGSPFTACGTLCLPMGQQGLEKLEQPSYSRQNHLIAQLHIDGE